MASPVTSHNAAQRHYFEERPLPRMAPGDTPYLNRQVDVALDALQLAPGARVAEVGCGMGRYTFLLARRGLQVEGLDLSPVLLERLTEHDGGRYGLPVHAVDLQAVPETLAGRYDAVVGFFMLHHIADLPACFSGVARLLKPGGRAAFIEPNPLCALYYVQIAVSPGMTWAGDKGILDMRPGKVATAMRDAGLDEPRTTRFGFLPPVLANRSWGARLERGLERIAPLRPVSAFQRFQATKR